VIHPDLNRSAVPPQFIPDWLHILTGEILFFAVGMNDVNRSGADLIKDSGSVRQPAGKQAKFSSVVIRKKRIAKRYTDGITHETLHRFMLLQSIRFVNIAANGQGGSVGVRKPPQFNFMQGMRFLFSNEV
jgi:hypothetical protein